VCNRFPSPGYFDLLCIEHHIKARQIELSQSLAHRKKVYLDACFWIAIRDAHLGARKDAPAQELLSLLRQGVDEYKILCPISGSMFLELVKQPHTEGRRIGTAKIIDELSLGVAMIPPPNVMATEIYVFLLEAKDGVDLHPIQELIWTKAAHVLGDLIPSSTGLSPTDEDAVQKQFFDHLWDYSLLELINTVGDQAPPTDGFDRLSKETNRLNAMHQHELRSFEQAYDTELRGAVQIAGEIAADIIKELAEKDEGRKLTFSHAERACSVNMCQNLIYRAFKNPTNKDTLRSVHVGASIHAGMRWDKFRNFKPNDYYDFAHATAALSYCDVFLTDGPLHHLVTQLELEAVNECKTISDRQAAVEHIQEILSSD